MVMAIKNPELPATKKQLWLLHILTKTDTRNLNITMSQASQKIADAKQKPSSKSTKQKPDKTMLGNIEITLAYKEIAKHDNGFSITTKINGVFPHSKKPHALTWYHNENKTIINPLYGRIRNSVEIDTVELNVFIKNLPIKFREFKNSNEYNVPENIKPIAEQKAKLLDDSMELYYCINGEYRIKTSDEIIASWNDLPDNK